jgi:hypothetical protein
MKHIGTRSLVHLIQDILEPQTVRRKGQYTYSFDLLILKWDKKQEECEDYLGPKIPAPGDG